MFYFMISLLAVGLLVAWLVPVSRGASRRADGLKPALVQLMNCEVPDAFLTVRPNYSPYRFIQFSRTQGEGGSSELELAFPLARWSEEFFPKIVSIASEENLPYEVRDEAGSGLRFVFVGFGDSACRAATFGQKVLTDVFGFQDDYGFRVRIN